MLILYKRSHVEYHGRFTARFLKRIQLGSYTIIFVESNNTAHLFIVREVILILLTNAIILGYVLTYGMYSASSYS